MPVFLRWLLRLAPINPITVRLVQGGSRRVRHLYIRSAYLGALIVVLIYMLLIQTTASLDERALASVAAGSFQIAAYLQIGLICLLAPVFMAGAIAQEANPKTWDILLTTPMSATQIVLGNLFGRLFFILALLCSSLPLFALTQLFGGVPGRSILASYAIAACAALLVGSMAIALSVSRLVGKRAVFAFYVGVVSYLAVTWAADRLTHAPGMVSAMTALNPFLALRALLDPSGYTRFPAGSREGLIGWMLERPVTAWCVLSGTLSVALMALSTLTVRLGGLVGMSGGGGGAGGIPWYRKIFGLGASGAEHRPPRAVWSNPIAWREAAARNATLGRMVARWSFIGVGALAGILMVVMFHFGGMALQTFRNVILSAVLGELIVVTLVALNMSATSVAREREDGTLDLLLTTPITPTQYLGGKVRGMVAYLLPLLAVPIGTLLLAGVYVGAGMLGVVTPEGSGVTVAVTPPTALGQTPVVINVPAILPEAGVLLGVVSVPFIAFCCMIGLQWSLKSKGSISSVVATVGIVGVIALVTGLCSYTAGSGLSLVGPALAPVSPGNLVFATVIAESGLQKSIDDQTLDLARVGLAIGSLLAGGIYLGVVYGLRANMVHTFDMTVRRLAGTA